jgi:hypothetical protein
MGRKRVSLTMARRPVAPAGEDMLRFPDERWGATL